MEFDIHYFRQKLDNHTLQLGRSLPRAHVPLQQTDWTSQNKEEEAELLLLIPQPASLSSSPGPKDK